MCELYVSADFEGANPPKQDIIKLGSGHYSLKVYSETPIESFRMDTMIVNNSPEEQSVTLDITWPTEPFSQLRDCFYWKHETMQDWITVPADTGKGKSWVTLNVVPGKGFLCLHPRYSYEDCECFIAAVSDQNLVKTETVGESNKGRDIKLIKISDSKGTDKRRVLVIARNHANETSGSYCIEGMINWLLSNESEMPYLLSKIDFYFLPMTNPDGVADGMARLTGIDGADLNKTSEWLQENSPNAVDDKSHAAFFKVIDSIKPTHFMNLHSYLFKFKDEIYGYSEQDIKNFIRFCPDDSRAGKIWKQKLTGIDSPFPTSYSLQKYKTTSLLLEIPWFGRSAESMRQVGVKLLKSMILMNTLKDEPWGEL